MMDGLRRFWHKLFPCRHEWVQGEQFWDEMEPGVDHSYLKPSPMKYHSGYQANCYVCKKCKKSVIVVEKIETNENRGDKNDDYHLIDIN